MRTMREHGRSLLLVALAACVCVHSGCSASNPFTRSFGIGPRVRLPSADYTVIGVVGKPEQSDAPVAEKSQPIKIELHGIAVSDCIANDFERRLLQDAGIAQAAPAESSGTSKTPLGEVEEVFFSHEFRTMVGRGLQAKAARIRRRIRQVKGRPSLRASTVEDLEGELYKATAARLKAKYKVTIELKVQSFDHKSQTFRYEKEIEQEAIDRPVTALPEWRRLIYRGHGADIMTITLTLERTSLIARALQKGLDELRRSTLFADTFESVFAGASEGILRDLGKKVGAALDRKVAKTAQTRYGPRFVLGNKSFEFMTKEGAAEPHEAGLIVGTRILKLTADMAGEAQRRDLLAVKLVTSELRK